MEGQSKKFTRYLREQSIRHEQSFEVEKKHYKHFSHAFMKTIKKHLDWTNEVEAAWEWFWKIVINEMTDVVTGNILFVFFFCLIGFMFCVYVCACVVFTSCFPFFF